MLLTILKARAEPETGQPLRQPLPDNFIFTGAATYKIPIDVPPGRAGIAPQIPLTYNSYQGNGWAGVGWSLDMGSIQRSLKRGVNYANNEFVAFIGGSTGELIPRPDWGENCYGAKIEGAYTKYCFNPADSKWLVTTKDGKKYYYGTTPDSRQSTTSGIFKWCLDRVEDPNGNYMTVTYWISNNNIYPFRIEYTGNGSLSPTNSIQFYVEPRNDAQTSWAIDYPVSTSYRLKTIDVYANGNRVCSYKLSYTYGSTGRSLLSNVDKYGTDAILDVDGTVIGGTYLPLFSLSYQNGGNQLQEYGRTFAISDNGGRGPKI